MIVCPECRFENPDGNQFCQDCGSDLRTQPDQYQNTAEHFGDASEDSDRPAAPADDEYPSPLQLAIVFGPSAADHGNPNDALSGTARTRLLEDLSDSNGCIAGRYKIQTSGSGSLNDGDAEAATVIDTQPSTPTLLGVSSGPSEGDVTNSTLEDLLASLPKLVRIHLLLQDELYPSCPQVYDTWSHEGYTILFLEDRTSLPTLLDAAEAATVDEQLLHWCYDTVQLWELLVPYHCHRSLLTLDNLRVDDDQILCLRRLYQNQPTESYPLSRLGTLWQQAFGNIFNKIPELKALCNAIESGEIATIGLVKQRLETIRINHDDSPPSPAQDDRLASVERPPTAMTIGADSQPGQDDLFDDGEDLPTVVLPMQLYSLSDAGQTDVGRQRKHNEDCFFIQTDIHKVDSPNGRTCRGKGLYILCDGMGGHASGEVASRLAVTSLRQSCQSWTNQLPTEPNLSGWIQQANQAIYDRNQKDDSHGNKRMGTTLVMLMVQGLHVAIAHVGDSRLYRVTRKLGLEQLTVDHEVGQREIHRGIPADVAYSRKDAYQLTQALGPRGPEFLRPDIQHLPITEDALFILASDGLTDNALLEEHYDTHVEYLLSSQANLEQGIANLIGLANQHNGHDNITAIAVRIKLRPILQPIGL